jgi:2-amino-4-hydroxy-6-hydroxymethyldihydropteridine diphosphokinase
MIDVFIGFGSNMGDPVARVREALGRLLSGPDLEKVGLSSLYRTQPVGVEDQAWFVNGVAWLRSALGARALMERLLRVEKDMGRVRTIPSGPRVIDLDLLMYGDMIVDEVDLRVPHPRLHTRRFVLAPLCEIAPHAIHPVFGRSIRSLLGDLEDPKEVETMGHWEGAGC